MGELALIMYVSMYDSVQYNVTVCSLSLYADAVCDSMCM